jgi:hypothetical protein
MAAPTVITARQFIQRFPEFRETDKVLIELCLVEAEDQVGATVWGNRRAIGVRYLAAHLIAAGPTGEKARLAKDMDTTVYLKHFRRAQLAACSGFRVVGEDASEDA